MTQFLFSIANKMGTFHGLPEKVCQIIGFKNFNKSTSDSVELFQRQNKVCIDSILSSIESEIRAPARSIFSEISERSICASIGQVHQAKLLNGERVAIKIQYPDVSDRITRDLSALTKVVKPIGSFLSRKDTESLQGEIKESLLRELDYLHEAEEINKFHKLSESIPWLRIPKAYIDYSTRKLLVMEWLDGETIEVAINWPKNKKVKLCQRLLDLFLLQWLSWGEVNADPHPGNLKILWNDQLQDVELVLYDFGVTYSLSSEFKIALLRLIDGKITLTEQEVFDTFISLGFNPALLAPMKDKLSDIREVLTKPFSNNEPFSAESWKLSETLEKILGEDRWNFRVAGPAHLIYFLRSFSGLINYQKLLNQPFSWCESLQKITAKISKTCATQKNSLEPSLALNTDKELSILVCEDGKQVVKLRMKAEVLTRIDEVMPDGLVPRLTENGIDVFKLCFEAVNNNYPVGEIFRADYPSEGSHHREILVSIV